VHQRLDAPVIAMQMDRTRLQQLGLSARNLGQNVLISLSGSSQTAPAFWLNSQNGVVCSIAVQTPQYRFDSLDARRRRNGPRSSGCSAGCRGAGRNGRRRDWRSAAVRAGQHAARSMPTPAAATR
jgi:hypothetical protein